MSKIIGIDLGTTNSAIARMENGKPVILKSDLQKELLKQNIEKYVKLTNAQFKHWVNSNYRRLLRTMCENTRKNNTIKSSYIEW